MSWAGLAQNQAVSWRDLQDAITNGYFAAGGTGISVNDQCIYKSLATIPNYVAINTAWSTYASRATNDLLLKRDFCPYYSYTIYVSLYHTTFTGYTSSALACAHAGTTITIYSPSSSITAGAKLYYFDATSNGFFPFGLNNTNDWFYDLAGDKAVQMGTSFTNTVAGTTACITYTTWLKNGGISYASTSAACAAGTGGPTLYSSISGMVTSVTTFYTNTALTTPFNGGGLIWSVSLGPTYTSKYAATINSSGVVTSYTTC
ncbi:MAG: hypothetical protein WCP46_00045 [Alphaproteobacteria bacterium]